MKRLSTLVIVTLALFSTANAQNSQQKTVTDTANKFSIHITKADFIKKISNTDKDPNNWNYLGDKPCIIDFYTTWCGPCRMLSPILEEIAKENKGKLYVYKVDAEKEKELARIFQVQSYPTMIFCPMNGNPQMAKGALPKAQIESIMNQILFSTQTVTPPPPLY